MPFSEAVRAGDTLYLAGQIGNQPGRRQLVPGGIGPEACLRKMPSKCSTFNDIKDWPAFNEVYVQFFKKNLPARSALAASGLALGARVEVECVACVPGTAK